MAAAPARFSWVNYTSTSVVEKDEGDTSIIKSHAMRMVHRQRQKRSHRIQLNPGKQPTNQIRQKPLRVDDLCREIDPVTYRPETDWQEVAICQFLEDFVYPDQSSPVIAFQYLSFLPALYNKNSARSCLTEAISAVAFARLANQNRADDLSLRARKAYANALSLVNKSMSVPEMRKSDHVLTSLCLLAKYELFSGDANIHVWQSHERGQAALICERDPEWLRSDVGASLFRLVYIRHLLNCVAQSERPAIYLDQHSQDLAFPAPCLRNLMGLIDKIANLRYDAATQLPQKFKHPKEACRLAEEAIKIDADITTLVKELPAEMEYYSIVNNLKSAKGIGKGYVPKVINIFQDLQHASFWHVFFYARLHVLETLLQCSSFQLQFQSEELRTRLLKTVDDICASVPFALNETNCHKAFITTKGGRAVAAHYLIWLLVAASSATGVPDAQREWISDRLAFIGFVHGIKEALAYA